MIPEIKQTPGGDVKLRLKLYAHRKYAVLECVPEDIDFLYDCGIGYLCGLYGLKKDIFKAADAFHENIELYQNRMESCFELGAMFRHLEEIRSREDALHYLTMAANAKHSGARFELAELLLESSDSADITKGKALLAELLQEGYESYGDQIEIADILENI